MIYSHDLSCDPYILYYHIVNRVWKDLQNQKSTVSINLSESQSNFHFLFWRSQSALKIKKKKEPTSVNMFLFTVTLLQIHNSPSKASQHWKVSTLSIFHLGWHIHSIKPITLFSTFTTPQLFSSQRSKFAKLNQLRFFRLSFRIVIFKYRGEFDKNWYIQKNVFRAEIYCSLSLKNWVFIKLFIHFSYIFT